MEDTDIKIEVVDEEVGEPLALIKRVVVVEEEEEVEEEEVSTTTTGENYVTSTGEKGEGYGPPIFG